VAFSPVSVAPAVLPVDSVVCSSEEAASKSEEVGNSEEAMASGTEAAGAEGAII